MHFHANRCTATEKVRNLTARLHCTALAIILLLLGTATANAVDLRKPASLTSIERVRIEAMLTDEVQRIVNAQKRTEGQGKHVTVKVRLNTRTEMIVVDLSRTYVPRYYGPDMEDLLRELTIGASDLLMDIISIQGVEFRYGGKDIYHYFPDERPPNPTPRKDAKRPAVGATVVVAAGHGAYFHYGYNDWRFQRDPFNGIQEDLITPTYAEELTTLDGRTTLSIDLHNHMLSIEFNAGCNFSG